MKRILLVCSLATILLLFGCSKKKNDNNSEETSNIKMEKKSSNEVSLHTVDGKTLILIKNGKNIKIKGVKDKVILLDFFATWCPPCKAEIPHLINLQKKYKDKLMIVSILLENDKPDSEIKSFIKYNGINYIVTNDQNNYKLSSMLGEIQSIPFMILYDKNGDVITHYLGAIPEEMINSDIKKAIR